MMETAAWILLFIAGIVSALAFGHSLGAPMRMRKMLDQLPKVPPPVPYEGLPPYTRSKGKNP